MITLFQHINLFDMIQIEFWKQVCSVERVLNALNSEKPIALFLDENDSDFNLYLRDILKIDQNFLSYYVDYIPLKKKQKTFAQTLLSALFIESKNVRTGKPFAEDVLRIIRKAVRLINYDSIDKWRNIRTASIFRVFSALLYGSEKERAASIEFLKCMKCCPAALWKFGLSQDLRAQENTTRFFSEILSCFLFSGGLDKDCYHQKFVICVGNIPIYEMNPYALSDSGLLEFLEQIKSKHLDYRLKLCLVPRGNLVYFSELDKFSFRRAINRLIEEYRALLSDRIFDVINIPLISDVATIEKAVRNVIKKLAALDNGFIMSAPSLIPDKIVRKFSNMLMEQNKGKARIIDISKWLLALFATAIEKNPIPLDSDDLYTLFSG